MWAGVPTGRWSSTWHRPEFGQSHTATCCGKPRAIRALAAMPPVSELATVYREELGSEVPQLDWFQALACFKSAAT
jgi:hypothetical protein